MKKLLWVIFVFLLLPVFSAHAAMEDIVINEVLSDPTDTANDKEFIEIKNNGDTEIDLSGFYTDDIEGGSSPKLIASGTKIEAGGYLVFYMKGILNNDGDSARLLNPDKTLVTEVAFGKGASKDVSFARKTDGTYEWTTKNTPGGENVFDVIVPTPTPTPTPVPTPTSTPTPTATPTSSPTPTSTPTPTPSSTPDYSWAKFLIVNEALPDPAGNDGENEFIEIKNTFGQAIDLSNFYIDDAEGGSSPYKIPAGTTIEANNFLVFYSRDTKISLNNTSGDSARLLYPDKKLLTEMSFDKSPKADNSYARKTDGSYDWTAEPTPGEENSFVDADSDTDSTPTPTPKTSATTSPASSTKPKTKAASSVSAPKILAGTTVKYARKSAKTGTMAPSKDVLEIKIEDLKQTPIGTMIKVRGTVSQNPGTFDQQLMYLAGSGVGVYLSQGVFPELAIGDTVTVTGVLAKPSKEFFVVVGGPEDIVKDGAGDIPTPHKINISEITEENIGWLVSVEGEITQKEKDHLTLKDGDKQLEILLAKETNFKVGDRVVVTGIVATNGDNLRILASDVELASGETSTIQNNIKNSVINHWKEVVSVFCFSCAAVLFVYAKIKPRKILC
jgi:hypothetical protein